MSYAHHIPWGWNDFLESFFELHKQDHPTDEVGRVLTEERGHYQVLLPSFKNIYWAQVSGTLRHEALGREDFPAVGDWVCVSKPAPGETRLRITSILPRKGCLKRKAAGTSGEIQIFASYVDEVLIVTSCNLDLSLNRLDRALTLASSAAVRTRIVLSKKDLVSFEKLQEIFRTLDQRFVGVPVVALSSVSGEGFSEFKASLMPQNTYVVLGSSGVGKSTLLNLLLGVEVLKTQEIREDDDKGRHTTVSRSLHQVDNGALVIDTPGIRELQLYEDEEALNQSFSDIAELALRCRFTNCGHSSEPGCAIKCALEERALDEKRWESYLKLQREMEYQARKGNKALESASKQKWLKLTKNAQARKKFEKGG